MIKKQLLQQYIDSIKELRTKEDAISSAFSALDRDNTVLGIVPYSFMQVVDDLMKELMSEESFDMLMWWIYDCEFGTKRTTIWNSSTKEVIAELNSIDALYDYLEKM